MKVKDLFWVVVLGAGALYAYDTLKSQPTDPVTPTDKSHIKCKQGYLQPFQENLEAYPMRRAG